MLDLQYDYKKWTVGLMARDITTTFNTWDIDADKLNDIQATSAYTNTGQSQEVPEDTEITLPKLQLGIARTFEFKHKLSLLTELDFDVRFAETNDIISSSFASITPALGLQLNYNNLVFLRSGVGKFQNIEQLEGGEKLNVQPNLGLGFHYKGIYVDYSLTNIGKTDETFYSNIFSLKLDWSIFSKK